MRKSPFAKEIVDEWDYLTFTERKRWLESPEVSDFLARSQRLYDKCFAGGSWAVNIDDAGLVTLLCRTTSMIQNNWEEAILIINRWLTHPDASKADDFHHGDFIGNRALCHFLKGDFEAFLADFKSSLNYPERGFGVMALNSLLVIYGEKPPEADQTVNPWLKKAALLTAEKLKPGKRITAKIEISATDAELHEILTAWKSKIAANSRKTRVRREETDANSSAASTSGQIHNG